MLTTNLWTLFLLAIAERAQLTKQRKQEYLFLETIDLYLGQTLRDLHNLWFFLFVFTYCKKWPKFKAARKMLPDTFP